MYCASPLCKSKLTVSLGIPVNKSRVANSINFLLISAGVKSLSAKSKAITPATWGDAIDVPEMVRSAVDEPFQAPVISEIEIFSFLIYKCTLAWSKDINTGTVVGKVGASVFVRGGTNSNSSCNSG
jgi:hypothetical protein